MTVGSDVARAAELLRAGALVGFPTETVYGLGALASNDEAVAKVFEIKGRPSGHPLIIHLPVAVGSAWGEELGRWAVDVPSDALVLADAFWPGPLTLLLRRRPGRAERASAALDTIAVRVPAHPMALALLDIVADGIAAPSANRFGRVSPTAASHVVEDLGGDVSYVLDGGRADVGVESTIVDLSGDLPLIVRAGAITSADLSAVIDETVHATDGEGARAPGSLRSHYAPAALVELSPPDGLGERVGELIESDRRVGAILWRGRACPAGVGEPPPGGVEVLGEAENVEQYARCLYEWLRRADRLGIDVVLAQLPPDEGIGRAVGDRLRRASRRRGLDRDD